MATLALLVALWALLAAACDRPGDTASVQPSSEGASPLQAALDAETRPEADRARDADRRPAAVLRFFGIQPGQRVGELMAGSGYYTEILSYALGPEGRLWAHNSPFVMDRYAREPFRSRLERLPLDNVVPVVAPPESPGLPAGLDVVLLIRFYHDFFWQDVDRDAVNRAVFEALRPGGVYGVVDHHAEAGSGARDVETLHRVDRELVVEEITAAGFVLDDESDVLRQEEDDRSWNIFVDDGARRDETDRFVLRFVKPR